ncbi:ribonuclease H-like domain-containing protein [Tanacetum coccineum]
MQVTSNSSLWSSITYGSNETKPWPSLFRVVPAHQVSPHSIPLILLSWVPMAWPNYSRPNITISLARISATAPQDPTTGAWNMDTGASSHLNDSVTSVSDVLNMCIYQSVSIGDGYTTPVTNFRHSILPIPHTPLHLNNVLTPNIVMNLIYVRLFVRDNNCTVEFDTFGFSVKDFMTRRVLLRCDSTGDIYPDTKPSTIPHAFLIYQYTWHQRLGYPRSEVLRRILSSNSISCTKEKPLVLCHACQLGKHVRLPFVMLVKSCFDIVHSDLWTS